MHFLCWHTPCLPLLGNQIPFSLCIYLQVKILNKLASAKASGKGGGSKVLNDLVEGLEEPAFSVELRLKIDQNHADLKGGYDTIFCSSMNKVIFWQITIIHEARLFSRSTFC